MFAKPNFFIFSLFLFLSISFSFSFSFSGAQNLIIFGLNCFTISENICSKKKKMSRLGRYPFGASFPFFLVLLFSFCFSTFFLFCSFKHMPLLAFVWGFYKRCFLHCRCCMETWCLDDTGRDSWDWVGSPTGERARFNPQSGVEAPHLFKRSLPGLYYC